MKLKPYQKSEIKMFVWTIVALILLIGSAYHCCTKDRLIFHDKQTGTKYYDRGNYNEVVFSSGEVLAYGNEKTEYENGEIGE